MKYFTLSNGIISRTFEICAKGVRTVSFMDLTVNRELIHAPAREYAFSVDDVGFSSWSENFVHEVNGNVVHTDNAPEFVTEREFEHVLELDFRQGTIFLTLRYELLPDAPGMRKVITFTNESGREVKLSALVFDDTCISPGSLADCDFYAGTGDAPQSVCFTLEGTEDIIRCHNPELNAGWIMGSSAPGVLRYYMVYPNWGNAINGCNMSSAPFCRYLAPGEKFQSPSSLLALYHGSLGAPETETAFRSLVRQYLPALNRPERVMYCSWLPFLKNINFDLCADLVQRAARFGFGYFVLDDGWFTDENREVDRTKFPDGLSPLADLVRASGMIFGLWLNIGTDYGMKDVPEAWYARRSDGKVNRLGFDYATGANVLCLASEYQEAVIQKLQSLANDFEVGYFKLDFSSIASPYGILPWGCHAKNHRHHGWDDSFGAIYEAMRAIRDALGRSHPDLIVDFSFEAFGCEKPSIAALDLSRLHHATNTSALNPRVHDISRARKNFYRWAGKLPPERILNGLLSLGTENALEYLLTSFVGAPLTSGDLRKIPPELCAQIQTSVAAFNRIADSGAMTEFKVLSNETDFDAFMRCTRRGDGFVCAFNHSKGSRDAATLLAGKTLVPVTGKTTILLPDECAMFQISNQQER